MYVTVDRGQGLNNAIKDAYDFVSTMKRIKGGEVDFGAALESYNADVVKRGAEEVELSRDNAYMIHDWNRIQESPLFKHSFSQVRT
jgi:2-polyprenyl-6-methoxyphenol hydroxylase-like FAD-dependent oxidoreductase